MGRYFGTDGVRGVANESLKAEQAWKIGEMLGFLALERAEANPDIKPVILIGKDTRRSGDLFEAALAAGVVSMGAEARLAGILPTGAISLLTQNNPFAFGVMISASHNPYTDNGIKIFDGDGSKLEESVLEKIEDHMDGMFELPEKKADQIGKIEPWPQARRRYLDLLYTFARPDLSGLKIAIDTSQGSLYEIAKEALEALGASVDAYFNEPDGLNINLACGSTHPQALQEIVAQGNYDLGFLFDGDADRLLIIDENGRLLSGDHYLYLMARHYQQQDNKPERIVSTVMANLGLAKALENHDIELIRTDVGDKYVFEEMERMNDPIGGEQSGHIIFLEHAKTGDGLLSALKFLELFGKAKQPLSEMADELIIYPQILVNIRVDNPREVLQDEGLQQILKEQEKAVEGRGRINLRASGTEPLIRVMVEAESEEACHQIARPFVDYLKEKKGGTV